MSKDTTTRDIATALVTKAEAGNTPAPSRTREIAEGAVADLERYGSHVAHVSEDTTNGALARFAASTNLGASYDGRQVFDDPFDPDAVIEQLAQAVRDRRNGK